MSQFFSRKFLKYRDAPSLGGPITDDRACRGCGYNLRGLRVGGVCPECGSPITAGSSLVDLMLDCTEETRRKWWLGLTLATLAVVSWAGLRIVAIFTHSRGGAIDLAVLIGFTIVGVAWTVAVFFATPVSIGQRWPARKPLRHACRILTLAVPCAMIAWVTFEILGTRGAPALKQALGLTILGGRLLGGLGALLFLMLLIPVAEDAELAEETRRLRSALWWLPMATIIETPLPYLAWGAFLTLAVALIVPALVIAGWLWIVSWLVRAVYGMQQHVAWARRLAVDAAGREARILTQRAAYDEAVEATIRPVPGRPWSDDQAAE